MKGWLVKWTSPDSGYEEAVATVLSARLGVRSVVRRLKELFVIASTCFCGGSRLDFVAAA